MAGPDYKECNCGWLPIATAPEQVDQWKPVDLWLHIYASPRSMGMSDSFRVTDCWKQDGKWVHRRNDNGRVDELFPDYITHWQPLPAPPLHPGRGVR